jgi:transposase
MPKGKRLTMYERGKIDAKREQGMNMSEIAISLHRSVNAVKHYLENPAKYGQKTRAGRPAKLSEADKRQIIRHASNSTTSVMEIKRALNIDASKTTIWKAMKASGVLQHRKLKKMPRLKAAHKQARLDQPQLWLESGFDWEKVVFPTRKSLILMVLMVLRIIGTICGRRR